MDGAKWADWRKKSQHYFVLTAFISFGRFIIHPGIGSNIEFGWYETGECMVLKLI
jgi:hypothetical protein